jgi:hypothetical protein
MSSEISAGTKDERRNFMTHLSTTDKHDRLACHICHRQRRADLDTDEISIATTFARSTHLVIHRIPLCDDHPVDAPLFARASSAIPARCRTEVPQRTIKLGELVHSFVPDESLADEDDLVRAVRCNKFGERTHEGLENRKVEMELKKIAKPFTSLSCIRPAVSMRTTSKSWSFAVKEDHYVRLP